MREAVGRTWIIPLVALAWGVALFACGDDQQALDPSADAGMDGTTGHVDGGPPVDARGGDAARADAGDGSSAGDAAMDAATDAPTDADAGAAPDAGAVAPFCRLGQATCMERLDVNGRTLPYYRSHSLGTPNPAIRNVVVILHGNSRNADAYFATMAGLAFARDPVGTLVLAPYFQAIPTNPMSPCAGAVDAPAPADLYWSCEGWKDGNAARNDSAAYSFALLDMLVANAKAAFPTIERVTIVGYSAGAQTVQRAIAGSTEQDATPAITTRWVVASPSSYLYLDDARLKADATCDDVASCAIDGMSFETPYSGSAACPTFDDYTYGFASRTGYLRAIAPNSASPATESLRRKLLRDRYVSRSVAYIVSEGDGTNTAAAGYSELDKGCEATAQGPLGHSYRLQRGLAYYQYVTQLQNAMHRLAVVPLCGHDQACVLADPIAQAEIFDP